MTAIAVSDEELQRDVRAELKWEGSQVGDVLVEAGDEGTPFGTHLVHKPRVVRPTLTQPGEEADIEIESEEGVTTLVRIRRRPELPPAPGSKNSPRR